MKMPSEFQTLFPSAPIENLDTERDKFYIINSLLKRASGQAWKWMVHTYSTQEIIDVIQHSPDLHPRQVYVWSYYYNIPYQELVCSPNEFQKTRRKFWIEYQ